MESLSCGFRKHQEQNMILGGKDLSLRGIQQDCLCSRGYFLLPNGSSEMLKPKSCFSGIELECLHL